VLDCNLQTREQQLFRYRESLLSVDRKDWYEILRPNTRWQACGGRTSNPAKPEPIKIATGAITRSL